MASTDATAIPVKNQAYRVTFPIWDADGDLVTGATALDSEVSKDAGTFADCTNEATEIATSSGMYYLDLTNTEMNADTVAIIVKTSSSGAKTTPIILYPQEAGDIQVNLTYWNGTAVATPDTAGYPKVTIKDGTGTGELDTASGVVLARDHTGAALATPTNITAGTITTVTNLTNAPTNGDLTATMKTSVTTAATAATPTAAAVTGNVGGNVTGSVGSVATGGIAATSFAAGAIDAVAIATDAIGSAEISAAAVTKIQAGLSTYAGGDTAGTTTLLARLTAIRAALLDNLDAAISSRLASASYTTPPTVLAIADQVWDEALAGHLTGGSTGAALSAAGSAGDPWSTALPGAYGAGTAGKIVGDNVNATISSRSSHTAADIWAVATRLLTAGTNIVLAKGVGVTGFNDLSAAQVNTEVDTALATDTYAEPGSVPAATSSIKDKIGWLFTLARNKRTTTSTTDTVRNDADTASIATSTISDDGTTFTRGEYT